MLLRLQLIPNLQSGIALNERFIFEGLDVSFRQIEVYPIEYLERLNRTSIESLLVAFFRYYLFEFDVFRSVVSMRGMGEVRSKTLVWRKQFLWRFSIEDPFETADSVKPHDLGATLSRTCQLAMFDCLRAGYKALCESSYYVDGSNGRSKVLLGQLLQRYAVERADGDIRSLDDVDKVEASEGPESDTIRSKQTTEVVNVKSDNGNNNKNKNSQNNDISNGTKSDSTKRKPRRRNRSKKPQQSEGNSATPITSAISSRTVEIVQMFSEA